ncbi:MAG: hypothetical protein WCV67_18475 [Victivallaceae bacterium]|jgi:hypothetical protein
MPFPGDSLIPDQSVGNINICPCRSRWAALIKKVYEVDPLKYPKRGGQMRIISFIEKKDQIAVIEKILRHCKLWVEPVEREPPVKAVVIPFESVHIPIDEFLANF